MPSPVSRRAFLAAASAAALAPRLLRADVAPATRPATSHSVNGGLITLPAKGTLYIANDFHTRHADFDRWLKRTDLAARLRNEEHAYGLILGDIVDAKPLDPEAERVGDLKMLDRVRELQAAPGGDRLFYVVGNHEATCLEIYDALKKQLDFNPRNRGRIMQALYASESGSYFMQWNFLERMEEEHAAYLRTLPLAVICGNGLLAIHAGPSRKAKGTKDLAERVPDVVKDAIWSRPFRGGDEEPQAGAGGGAATKPADADALEFAYNAEDVAAFLGRMDGSKLLVVGHTPLRYFPETWIHDGVARVGRQGVVMAASFGALPDKKNYLAIDLSRPVTSNEDLRPGREIQPLIPA